MLQVTTSRNYSLITSTMKTIKLILLGLLQLMMMCSRSTTSRTNADVFINDHEYLPDMSKDNEYIRGTEPNYLQTPISRYNNNNLASTTEIQINQETQSEPSTQSAASNSKIYLDVDLDQKDTIPGVVGIDFPNYLDIPLTNFQCHNQKQAGYYADIEAGCQAFHVCDIDGRQNSFLCPRGTIFNQPYLTCDWWFNVDCSGASEYYGKSLTEMTSTK